MRILQRAIVLGAIICMCCGVAEAGETIKDKLKRALANRVDTFGGGGSEDGAASGYGGMMIGLAGSVREAGPVLRLYTGNAQYAYRAEKQYELRSGVGGDAFDVDFAAQAFSAEAMLGYQFGWRGAWVKLLAGASYERLDVTISALSLADKSAPPADPDLYVIRDGDPSNDAAGERWGAKLRAEAWAPLSDRVWVSGDAAMASGSRSYSAFSRLGVRAPQLWAKAPQVTFGPEAAVYGASDYGSARAGGFASFARPSYEFTVSGGVSSSFDGVRAPYASFGIYRKF
ncbi:MAG: cellulose biosynthesis protein BcsS [Hyphomicrobiales bacterium]|nr:cellulose biosynthesis protein BcsS [Hyphomicrobiales bacterium]